MYTKQHPKYQKQNIAFNSVKDFLNHVFSFSTFSINTLYNQWKMVKYRKYKTKTKHCNDVLFLGRSKQVTMKYKMYLENVFKMF